MAKNQNNTPVIPKNPPPAPCNCLDKKDIQQLINKAVNTKFESVYVKKSDTDVGIFLDEGAQPPTCAYGNDVGYDLYALEDVEVQAGTHMTVRTGVHLALPSGMFAQINTRSSYGKHGMFVHHGVIDPGYTGEITVWVMNIANEVLHNGMIKKETFTIEKGDRVAQILFHKAETPDLKIIDELPDTERGDKGHGSSGK